VFKPLIVSASMLLLNAHLPAVAAETSAQPLSVQDCEAVAKAVGKATGIVLMTKVGPAPSYPEGVHGSACLISGKASGLTVEFEHEQDRIAAALPGWQHLEQFDADGPYSTLKGFAKGRERVFYTLSTDPPPATCRDNMPISACKVPHRRWTWTLTAAAFVQ
jgi:hypothetical protein